MFDSLREAGTLGGNVEVAMTFGVAFFWHSSAARFGVQPRLCLSHGGEPCRASHSPLTTHDTRNRRRQSARRLFFEPLEDRRLLAAVHPYQNAANRFDVVPDGKVNVQDVWVLDQEIKARGQRELPPPIGPVQYYYDVDGDDWITANDIDQVLRFQTGTLDQGANPKAEANRAAAPAASLPCPARPSRSRP
jgi:hypothetical protein